MKNQPENVAGLSRFYFASFLANRDVEILIERELADAWLALDDLPIESLEFLVQGLFGRTEKIRSSGRILRSNFLSKYGKRRRPAVICHLDELSEFADKYSVVRVIYDKIVETVAIKSICGINTVDDVVHTGLDFQEAYLHATDNEKRVSEEVSMIVGAIVMKKIEDRRGTMCDL